MIVGSGTVSGITINFSFRRWRAHLKKLVSDREGTPNSGIGIIFPKSKKELLVEYMAAESFGEPELQRYFALYPRELKAYHRDIMMAYKQYIRRVYLALFSGREIHNDYTFNPNRYYPQVLFGPIKGWGSSEYDEFNLMILTWEKYLNRVDYRGRMPAIALLGLRRQVYKQTILHTQPTDVIRIIARMCLEEGWRVIK
jgi:hypothetical protein